MDYSEISKLIQNKNQNGIIATIINVNGTASRKPGSKMIFWQDGSSDGSIGGGEFEKEIKDKALELLKINKSNELITYQQFDEDCKVNKNINVFLDKINLNSKIFIYGAGYVGASIAECANWLGFEVFLGDDRKDIINNQNESVSIFSNFCTPIEFVKLFKAALNKSLILATRTTEIDIEILKQISKEEIEYIGILGSKKRWNHTKSILEDNQIPTQFLEKIHSPIGLSINAQTPKEIAISVMGQIIQNNNYL